MLAESFEIVAKQLLATGRVAVPGFGVFELYRQKPRRYRNPRTGDAIDVPARTVARFKPATALKARVAAREKE
jgi:nucleoid DNA-binding protein